VATVDNRTTDPAFGLALRTALEADLARSSFLRVYEGRQIADTLRLMRREPTTPIDETLGRDICRLAGIRALVLPRILASGGSFDLQAIVVDPADGRHVEQIRVTVDGREDVLLHAIDDVSRRLRERLGEAPESIAEADAPVTQALTSSWEALQLFALGSLRVDEGRFSDAVTLFEQALARDPEFVVARAALGLVLIQHLDLEDRGRETLQEASARADRLPDWERRMLGAVHAQLVDGDLALAHDQYRTIAEQFPNRMEPLERLGQILIQLGRHEEAVAAFERAVALDDSAPEPLQALFWLHIAALGRPAEAERYARRLVELGPETAQFHHDLAWSLWAQDRLAEALVQVRRVVALEPRHAGGRESLPHLLLATGSAAAAEPLYRALHDEPERNLRVRSVVRPSNLGIVLRALGRGDEARAIVHPHLERLRAVARPTLEQIVDRVTLAAVAGQATEAEDGIVRAGAASDADAGTWFDLARAAALLGHRDQAVALLDRALHAGHDDPYFALICPGFGELRGEPAFRALFGLDRRPVTD
jgi:tetratricopeptide (TPR) repeat protein